MRENVGLGYSYELLFYESLDEGIFYVIDVLLQNIDQPDILTFCDSCYKNISTHIKIITVNGDYCVGCFAQLKKFPEEYRVMNHLDIVILDFNWTAEEECLLLEGIQQYIF